MTPQLRSMSSSRRVNRGVLLASLIVGSGFEPDTAPRPVVKQIRLAPLAIWPVTATGSSPGESMNNRPLAWLSWRTKAMPYLVWLTSWTARPCGVMSIAPTV
jgi:hypothetical protein